MTTFSVALHSYVHGLNGPRLVRNLSPGEKVFCSASSGRLVAVLVEDVVRTGVGPITRLFTPVGDPIIHAEVRLVMKGGLTRGSDIEPSDRIEVLPVGSVPYEVSADPVSEVGSVLGCLPGPIARIPASVERPERICGLVESNLHQLGVAFEKKETERWFLYRWEPVDYVGLPTGNWQEEADALMALTAWDPDGGVSRSGVDDDLARRHLCAVLFAAGIQHRTKWLPKYAPADCHLTLTDQGAPAFVPVDNLRREEGDIVRITVAEAAYLLSERGLVAPV